MLTLKHALLNLLKNKKIYTLMFVIIALSLYALISALAIRRQMTEALEEQFNAYAVVAVTGRNAHVFNINDGFIGAHTTSEHVLGYYAFTDFFAGSDQLRPLPPPEHDPYDFTFFPHWEFQDEQFQLIVYTDIGMSTHFWLGDREIISGRFAEDKTEINISEDLARLNNLSVGDYIEIYLFPNLRTDFIFEIVGIFADSTAEVSNELALIRGRRLGTDESWTRAGNDSISRNQLLTAATAADTGYFATYMDAFVPGLVRGHHVLVYYLYDEHSIFPFTKYVEDTLLERYEALCSFSNDPKQLGIIDSGDEMRAVHYLLNRTGNAFTGFLGVAGGFATVFILLTMFYVLRQRTYDIGVFRARGMSRLRLAFLLSSEFFMVGVLSFAAAAVLFVYTFVPLTRAVHLFQFHLADNDVEGLLYNMNFIVRGMAREYELAVSASPSHLVLGFAFTVVITVAVAFGVSLYIARHEPMKTMTEF
jgi:hypothetical protein